MAVSTETYVRFMNPDGLFKSPAFTQVVVTHGNVRTVYVGGQDAVDASGNIVGKGDIGKQTEQVLKNVETALAAGGAGLEHLVKCNVYLVQGQPLQLAFQAVQRRWGVRPNPPMVTGLFVAGLANPDFLIEVDAIALVPE